MARYKSANLQQTQIAEPRGAIAATSVAAQSFESLSSKLATFSQMAMQQHTVVRTTQAARDATLDVASRKQKIQKIKARGGSQNEIDSIVEGQAKTDATIYGRAYNTNFGSAYANQVSIDAKSATDMAVLMAEGSSKAFISAYPDYSKEIVRNAPTPELAIVAKQQFDQYGSAAYKSLAMAEQKEQNEQLKSSYENTIKLAEEQYITGDEMEKEQAATQYLAASKDAIKNGWTNEKEINYNLQRIDKLAFTEDKFKEFSDSEDPIAFLDKFRDNKKLSVEETQKAIDKMHSMMKSETDDYKIKEEFDTKEDEAFKKNTKDGINVKLIEGILTEDDLKAAYKANAITLTEYDDLLERSKTEGVAIGNEDMYQQVLMDIDEFALSDIYNDSTLSDKQKTSLIREKTDENAQQFRQATKQSSIELKNVFGIVEGTMMAQLDMENQLGKDYARLQAELYDFIQDIDPELTGRKRGSYALDFIRKRLDEYKQGEIRGTDPYIKLQDTPEPEQGEETIKGSNKMKDMINSVEAR